MLALMLPPAPDKLDRSRDRPLWLEVLEMRLAALFALASPMLLACNDVPELSDEPHAGCPAVWL